jgi:hypothetical protein
MSDGRWEFNNGRGRWTVDELASWTEAGRNGWKGHGRGRQVKERQITQKLPNV